MKKIFLLVLFLTIATAFLQAQLSVTKMVGKNSDKYKLGYCLFTFWEFPLNTENKSIRLELMDLAFFPGKKYNTVTNGPYGTELNTFSKTYLSIKLGYKYIFSETKTGIYVEPSAGWARVVDSDGGEATTTHGDGVALAFETGYSLEVGQRGHVLNFGLKYENDRAGSRVSSLGFRISYAFNLFNKRWE